MKWPRALRLIRHDTSGYNILKDVKAQCPLYQKFLKAFEQNPDAIGTRLLANSVWEKHQTEWSDADTPLHDEDGTQAVRTGQQLALMSELPDVVFVSPYERTMRTLAAIIRGWPALGEVKQIEDERIREQEHGLAILYNDWKVFQSLHPEQRLLYQKDGPYYYRYPQGENRPDVRARCRSWTNTVVRDWAGKSVLAITHHLTILSFRANLERLGAEGFEELDTHHKPINCGVTTYLGDETQGEDGRLILHSYNEKLY